MSAAATWLPENLAIAAFELKDAWERGGLLDARRVPFADFFAAKFASCVLAHVKAQHPELYDEHRAYDPRELLDPDPIPSDAAAWEPDESHTQLTAAEQLARDMAAQGIPVASQPGALALVAGVESGEIVNGRQAGKALGDPNYKQRPATAPLFAARDYLDDLADQGRTFKL